jgi:acyl transferase domain-containing protein/phosphopantetheinyl transferase (holo-ACP synthase)
METRDIAIVGMACLFPGAPNLDAYWHNILGKVSSISDAPPEAWDTAIWYNPDGVSSDQVYTKKGGWIGPLAYFDPLANGIPPVAVGGEPDQWLALQLARDALADAGYPKIPDGLKERTSLVLGRGAYLNSGNLAAIQHGIMVGQTLDVLRTVHPDLTADQLATIKSALKKDLLPVTPETVPGMIPNLIVGRVANRLDVMGPTYTVDAACASSLVALELAVGELQRGEIDLAVVGGAQVSTAVPVLNMFCQLGALSRRQELRPFDKDADGTLLGEGIGIIILKRRADAERDGNRIYAVVKGVGVASDGRAVGVLAPRLEGEVLALRRAYEAAGLDPRTVGLVEAHGTAAPVGDVTEVQALSQVFGPREGELAWCALGSVKSQISHTMPAAGIAGIIKTALALYHKVLPPTLNVEEPNPKLQLESSAFYLNTETRPWIHGGPTPRRAGVNAFGFGGINAHVVLEEYESPAPTPAAAAPVRPADAASAGSPSQHAPAWDSELFVLEADSVDGLRRRVEILAAYLDSLLPTITPAGGPPPPPSEPALRDLAYSVNQALASRSTGQTVRVGIVASTFADLQAKLAQVTKRLAEANPRPIRDVAGIYFTPRPLAAHGKLAFLFPGEGAQYANMLGDLCVHFPVVREIFDKGNRVYRDHPRGYGPSDYIFPRPAFRAVERDWASSRLWQIDGAIEAVVTADDAMLHLLRRLGLRPDAIGGHSSGEYAAMRAAGILDLEDERQLAYFAMQLNRNYVARDPADGPPKAALLAIGAGRERVEEIAGAVGGELFVAMDNCLHQAVLAGRSADVDRALEIVRREGLIYEYLSFDRAYHTPQFASYAVHLGEVFAQLPIQAGTVPTYSCTSVDLYPGDPAAIRTLMVDHWVKPVEFRRTIERMYADGVRIFVEVGPRGNLTSFVDDILRGRPYLAVASNVQRRSGITQLNHLLASLAAHGVAFDPSYLYERRSPRPVDWEKPVTSTPSRSSLIKLSTGTILMRLPEDVARAIRGSSANSDVAQPASPEVDVSGPAASEPTWPGLGAPEEPASGASTSAEPSAAPLPWLEDSVESGSIPVAPVPVAAPETVTNRLTSPSTGAQWPANAAHSGDPAAQDVAFTAFMQTMDQFLTVQADVMQTFLGAFAPVGDSSDMSAALPFLAPTDNRPDESVAEPIQQIETVQVADEIPGQTSTEPTLPSMSETNNGWSTTDVARLSVAPEPVPGGTTMVGQPPTDALGLLLTIIAERTGYPVELLGLDLDLEADLGIDSIKRVEILGTLRRTLADQDVDLESLAARRTIRQIVDALGVASTVAGSPGAELGAVATGPSDPLTSLASIVASYPLLGELVTGTPSDTITTRRTFDIDEDIYLQHHTLGRSISASNPSLLAMALLPMTMSLEILAEAAACLIPDLLVIGMRNVRANRWIAFDEGPQTLQVVAQRVASEEPAVRVQIRNLTEDNQLADPPKSPVAEAVVVFAHHYPERPPRQPFRLRHDRPSRWRDEQLYAEAMFHGPKWQTIASVTRTGDDGGVARGRVLPWNQFFRSNRQPRFVLDPITLDGAGQVPGFWTREHLGSGDGSVLFPFRADTLEIYEPLRPAGETYTCEAAITITSELQVRSDLDVYDQEGRLWQRLTGWLDKRFYLPPWFYYMMLSLAESQVSEDIPAALDRLPSRARLECRRLTASFPSDRTFWKRVWASSILSERERDEFRRLPTAEARQLAWLAGRMVAKETVHAILRREYGLSVPPADIEIASDELGRPIAQGAWTAKVPRVPAVSIASSGDTAVAVAGLLWEAPAGDHGLRPYLGIAMENLRAGRPGITDAAFDRLERDVLARAPAATRDEWLSRAFCAKAAAGNALGQPGDDLSRCIQVVALDLSTGEIAVRLIGDTAKEYPSLAATSLLATTVVLDGLVIATTVCEAGSHTDGDYLPADSRRSA